MSGVANPRAADRAGGSAEVHHGYYRPAVGLQDLAAAVPEVPSDQAAGDDERDAADQKVARLQEHSAPRTLIGSDLCLPPEPVTKIRHFTVAPTEKLRLPQV